MIKNDILKLLIKKFDYIDWKYDLAYEEFRGHFSSIGTIKVSIDSELIKIFPIFSTTFVATIKRGESGIDLDLFDKFQSKIYSKFPKVKTSYQNWLKLLEDMDKQ